MQTYTSQCKFDVNLHLKSLSLMQTYIKLAPHFLEHLQKYWIFFKKILVLFQKILVFSQTNDVYSANILILFKQILFSLNVFCQNMFGQSLFSINKSSTIHFLGEISHAHVNEFDDWRAPSHCKTSGLVFRTWIGMGRPKWLITSGLDCICCK